MISLITAVLISQLRFVDYRHEEFYQWPADDYVVVNELRFVAYDDVSVEKGDYACFVFEEVGPRKVCGIVRANVSFGLSWVVVDVEQESSE